MSILVDDRYSAARPYTVFSWREHCSKSLNGTSGPIFRRATSSMILNLQYGKYTEFRTSELCFIAPNSRGFPLSALHRLYQPRNRTLPEQDARCTLDRRCMRDADMWKSLVYQSSHRARHRGLASHGNASATNITRPGAIMKKQFRKAIVERVASHVRSTHSSDPCSRVPEATRDSLLAK